MNLSDAAVAQVMIPVDDFERGVAFYRDVLGIPFLFATPPMMAFFKSGAVRLLVGMLPPGQKAQRGSAIYFQVPDIRDVHATLSASASRSLPIRTSSIERRSPSSGFPSSPIPMAIRLH